MPRPSRERSAGAEANLARRIEHEREARGLSYEALAKAMTDAGCKIQGSAIYKIEKAEPPRRITVDELAALASVFGLPVADLLRPMEEVELDYAREMIKALQEGEGVLRKLIPHTFNLMVDLLRLARDHQELYDYVTKHSLTNPSGSGLSPEDRTALNDEVDPDEVEELHERAALRVVVELRSLFATALATGAGLWLEAIEGRLNDDQVDALRRALDDEETPWIKQEGWLYDNVLGGKEG